MNTLVTLLLTAALSAFAAAALAGTGGPFAGGPWLWPHRWGDSALLIVIIIMLAILLKRSKR